MLTFGVADGKWIISSDDGTRSIDACPCCNKKLTYQSAQILTNQVNSGLIAVEQLFPPRTN